MKRLLTILAFVLPVLAMGQDSVLKKTGVPARIDTFPIVGSRNIVMWGTSLTGSGRTPLALNLRTGRYVHNGGVHGETSTQIRTRMIADSSKYGWCTIYEVCRNNYASKATVLADLAAMIAANNSVGNYRYLVYSATKARTEISGTSQYNQIVDLNTDLKALYGPHFVNLDSFLVAQYNPSLPQDVIDHGNDVPPNSIMADNVHWNNTGDTLIAKWLISINFNGQFDNPATGVISSLPLKAIDVNNASMQNILFVKKGNVDYINGWAGEYNPQGWPAFSRLHWEQDKFFSGYAAGYTPSNGNRASGSYLYIMGYTSFGLGTTGSNITAIGGLNLVNATTASNQTALGRSALELTTGGGNVGIGTYAGRFNTTGTNNLWLGYDAGNNASQVNNLTNSTAFGYSVYTTRSNQVVIGNTAVVETQLRKGVCVSCDYVAPKTNAAFQVNSTTQGVMLPRMSTTQRNAISVGSGDSSLMVYDVTLNAPFMYDGSAWQRLMRQSDSALFSTKEYRQKGIDSLASLFQSGRYTPTITGGGNVASVGTVFSAHYTRYGNEVTITGSFQYTPTAGATPTYFSISVPNGWTGLNSNYGDAAGVATCSDLTATTSGFVSYTSNTADLRVTSLGTGTNTVHYTFTFTKN